MGRSNSTSSAYSKGSERTTSTRSSTSSSKSRQPVVATHGRPAAGRPRTATKAVEKEEREALDPAKRAEMEYAKLIIPYLAQRAYHLPGYTWGQDWLQYVTNNHPVFGLCCHHKLHPLNFRRRIVVLVGSIASGLAITNLVYLWFLLESQNGLDSEFVSIGLAANLTLGEIEAQFEAVSLTNYQAFLWTIGAALHSSFDLSVWYLSACACCLPGGCCVACEGYRYVGSYIVFFIVIVVAAAASAAVVCCVRPSSVTKKLKYTTLQDCPMDCGTMKLILRIWIQAVSDFSLRGV